MKLRKLTLTAVLTAAALVMFVLESQLPPLTASRHQAGPLQHLYALRHAGAGARMGARRAARAGDARLRHHRAGHGAALQPDRRAFCLHRNARAAALVFRAAAVDPERFLRDGA